MGRLILLVSQVHFETNPSLRSYPGVFAKYFAIASFSIVLMAMWCYIEGGRERSVECFTRGIVGRRLNTEGRLLV